LVFSFSVPFFSGRFLRRSGFARDLLVCQLIEFVNSGAGFCPVEAKAGPVALIDGGAHSG
jgi:hypothetical protein